MSSPLNSVVTFPPLGLDIGGANLKISDGHRTLSWPFPLWKSPAELKDKIRELLQQYPVGSPLAVTMTGELADCFKTRREGVHQILTAVEAAATDRPLAIWQTGGEFLSAHDARDLPELVAAANWHALATWAGRMAPVGPSLLVDVGSTTTDIIPLEEGIPVPEGRTDLERLASGELLYLGVRRTPLCAVTQQVPVREQNVGVARELFATMQDVCLILELCHESPDDTNTANGRPATRREAAIRLARLVCSDLDDLSGDDVRTIAESIYQTALQQISTGLAEVIGRLAGPPGTVLFCGEGESLARAAYRSLLSIDTREQLSLQELIGPDHSQGACAYALSQLYREHFYS
ncbi:hydantoinase/oxoprolinase family protein [Planctomicrobium sp. SH664]|uniref:hydantoinase/oxoprolinase family protein n=1 Tax=Planctomicrobium sp. SH664 TaxID=3448125 RepID=UPI003F5BF423